MNQNIKKIILLLFLFSGFCSSILAEENGSSLFVEENRFAFLVEKNEIRSSDEENIKTSVSEKGGHKWWHDIEYTFRAGYAIGGTIPVDFPVEMRGLNSYTPKFNYRFSLNARKQINKDFSLETALIFERKGFKSDVAMKHYQITLEQGGEKVTGPFSGNVVINAVQTGITIPINAVWLLSDKVSLKAGPYLSFITDKNFHGYAYGEKVYDASGNWTGHFDAYIRRDEIRGEKIEIGNVYIDSNGNQVDKRGTFSGEEYNDFMAGFQYGVNIGCDVMLSRKWGVFADLSYGINSAFTDKPGNPVTMSLHPLYFTLGAIYRLK